MTSIEPWDASDALEADLHADTEADKRQVAVQNKARFEAFVRGSDTRAEALPREDIRKLGFATANLMMRNLLTGRYKPKSAKEAADIAKIAYDLGRREAGDEDIAVSITSPEARQRAMESIAELAATAAARKVEAGRDLPVLDIEEAELVDEEDIAAGIAAGLPRRSTTATAALARVPRESSTP